MEDYGPANPLLHGSYARRGRIQDAGGYSKTSSTVKDVNFVIIHPSSVLQVTKHAALKVFTLKKIRPATVIQVQYRFTTTRSCTITSRKGIYLHKKA